MPPLQLQERSKTDEIFGLEVLPDSPGNPLQPQIVLLGLQGQQTQQMHRVGVAGIDGEGLLAAELRIEITAGLHMPDAGLTERGGCTGMLRILPGCPAADRHSRRFIHALFF